MRYIFISVCIVAQLLWAVPLAFAQDQEAEEKSRLVRFVEEQISTPTMQIRLNGLEGALSSDISLSSITIADQEGVWLTLTDPRLVWNRSALFSGRLEVESLTAAALSWTRQPLADESLPPAEAGGLAIPELPVAVEVQSLQLKEASFAEAVFGLAARLSLDGRLTLAEGNLDTELSVERLDGPGGSLQLLASYDAQSTELDTSVTLREPPDGVLSNLLSIHDRPAVALTIFGGGPVSDLDLTLAFEANGQRVLDGSLEVNDGLLSSDLSGRFALAGQLSELLAPEQRAFFGTSSSLEADFTVPSEGGLELKSFSLESGAVEAEGRLVRRADGFIPLVNLRAALRLPDGAPVQLPGEGSQTTLTDAALIVGFDAARSDQWRMALAVQDLRTEQLSLPKVSLSGGGEALAPEGEVGTRVTFDLRAAADDVSASEAALQQALGGAVAASFVGSWADGSAVFEMFDVASDTAKITGGGKLSGLTFDGQMNAAVPDLSRFAGLANRALAGRADLALEGEVQLVGGGFDLAADGRLANAGTGIEALDNLLSGTTRLTGGARRDENGLLFRQLVLLSPQGRIELDGSYASYRADLSAIAQIDDLGDVDPRANGSLQLLASLNQSPPSDPNRPVQPLAIAASAGIADASLLGRPVPKLDIQLDGQLVDGMLAGELSGDGTVNSSDFDLTSIIRSGDEAASLQQLNLSLGPTSIEGDITYQASLLDGGVRISSTDISDLLALALVDGSGAIQADIEFDGGENAAARQDVAFDARVSGFRIEENRIGLATAVGSISDAFGEPMVTAAISGQDGLVAGTILNSVNATASTTDRTTTVAGTARLNGSTDVSTEAQITPDANGLSAWISQLSVASPFGDTQLLNTARIRVEDGVTSLADVALSVGSSGRLAISGQVGDRLELQGTLTSVPLNVANAVDPSLGLGGSLTGRFSVGGTPSAPTATFDADVAGLEAAALRQAGLGVLNASASGRFADNEISLSGASVRGDGLVANASGAIPLSGPGLRVDVRAEAPLALANRFLADRGATLSGSGSVTASVTGSLSDPRVNGLLSVASGTFVDPLSNLRLNGLNLLASLQGDRISINRANASLSGGGQVSISGGVGLSAGLPADLSINLSEAQYTDGEIFTVRLSAQLAVTGPLASSPLVGGQINIAEANVTIPGSLGGAGELLPVVHVNPSQPTLRTLARIEKVTPDGGGNSTGAGPRLDIQINAPNRIFLRGRGIDAELGGSVRIRGPLLNLSPVGSFDLIRGRLSILSKRIVLDEGSVRLTGTLDPQINLLALVQEGEVTAFIRLFGLASNLELNLSSSPELPEDEILAQILFGEGIGSLSPLQIASLATAAASLTNGSSGPGLADQIRQGLGVDDLDVVQDGDGNTAVRAGKYIQDNVYLETQAGAGGGEASINLDITRNLKAKGSVASDGNSKLGIFYERDY
ncbi:MAG: translocation/assembly module TamB domain-containing protein [Pseudomonadota bacterium]